MDGFSNDIPIDPQDELSKMDSVNADFVINGTQTELAIAKDIADNTDADIAVSIAGCFVESMECNTQCQQCLNGLVQRQLQDVENDTSKVKAAIDKSIGNDLSTSFATLLQLGVPPQDIIPGAQSTDGFDITGSGEGLDQNATINAVICPENTTPVLTGNGTIFCQPAETATDTTGIIDGTTSIPPATTLPVITSSGTTGTSLPPFTGGVTSSGAVVGPSPLPVRPIPPPQPTTTPQALPPVTPPTSSVQYGDCSSYDTSGTGGKRLDQILEQLPSDNPLAIAIRNAVQVKASQGIFGNPLVQVSSDGTCARIFYDNVCEYEDVCLTPQPPQNCPCPPATGGTGTVTTVTPAAGTNVCFADNVPDIITAMEQYSLPAEFFASAAIGGGLTVAINGLLSAFKDPKGFADGGLLSNGITALAGFLATNITYKYAKESLVSLIGPSCNTEAAKQAQLAKGFFQIVGAIPGLVPDYVRQTSTYQANYLCPYLIPNAAEFNVMWNQGLITDDQWRFGVRANAICEDWATLTRRSSQQLLTPDQLAIAKRRKLISDDDYETLIRRNGIVDQRIKDASFKLTEFVPGPSDLVRFMVRDAFDDQVAADFQLDKDFPDPKFSGRALQWAADQGMDESTFRYFWRSHWQIPSFTQLTEMLFRLPEDSKLPDGTPVKAVTARDVQKAIEINDMSPLWVPRLMATAYKVLTRVDARRAFEIGKLSPEELKRTYLNQGYRPEDADKLVEFAQVTSLPKQAKQAGNASTSEVLGWYKDDLIPKDQAFELLIRSGVEESKVSNYLDTADLRKVAKSRKEGIAALRKRWMTGEFNATEATDKLLQLAVSPDRIGELLFNWSLIRDAKYKAPTVGMLCDWWTRGFITMDEFRRRCENLGYSLVDAERIVSSCQGKLAERRQLEAEKLAKEAESRQRRLESDRRRAISDQRKLEKEIQKALADAAPCKPPPKPTCETNGSTK